MYKHSLALIALSVGLFSASQAKASTIDAFSLTNNGHQVQFSLTPSTFSTSCHDTGDFCYTGISVTDDGGTQTDATVEFTGSGGLDILNSTDQTIIDFDLKNNQPLYFTQTGTPPAVTFDTVDTFSLKRDGGIVGGDQDPNYTLTISDPPQVPEPSSLALMSTGLLAAAGAVRRRMKK